MLSFFGWTDNNTFLFAENPRNLGNFLVCDTMEANPGRVGASVHPHEALPVRGAQGFMRNTAAFIAVGRPCCRVLCEDDGVSIRWVSNRSRVFRRL